MNRINHQVYIRLGKTADVGVFEVVKPQWEGREWCYRNRGKAEFSMSSFETLMGIATLEKTHICRLMYLKMSLCIRGTYCTLLLNPHIPLHQNGLLLAAHIPV